MSFLTTLKQTRSGRIFIALSKIILCVIVGAFILWQYLIWPNYWDDKTIEDADLIPEVGELVAAEDNAATFVPIQNNRTDLEQSIVDTKAVYKEEKFYLGEEVISGLKLQQFVNESRPLVEKFIVASTKSFYQCPLSFGNYSAETEFCDLGALRQMSNLVLFHAHYNVVIGNVDRASILTNSVFRYGQLVVEQDTPPALIEYLVGLALYSGAIEVAEAHPEINKKIQSELAVYLITDASSGRVIQGEYVSLKDILLSGLSGQNPEERKKFSEATYFMRPNQTINNLAEVMRMNVEIVVTPCNQEPEASEADALVEKYQNILSIKGIIQPNVIGRTMLGVTLASLGQVRIKRCEINSQIEGLASN